MVNVRIKIESCSLCPEILWGGSDKGWRAHSHSSVHKHSSSTVNYGSSAAVSPNNDTSWNKVANYNNNGLVALSSFHRFNGFLVTPNSSNTPHRFSVPLMLKMYFLLVSRIWWSTRTTALDFKGFNMNVQKWFNLNLLNETPWHDIRQELSHQKL